MRVLDADGHVVSANALPPESRLLQPVQGGEGPFDATELAQRHSQAVLPRVAAEALQHQRRADHASADQRDGCSAPVVMG